MARPRFGVDQIRPAVLTIDLHHGHLDPEHGTLPLPAAAAARVTAANVSFLDRARAAGLPVLHMVTTYRHLGEIHSNPFWRAIDGSDASRAGMRGHNLLGSPGTELMPGIRHPGDLVLATKKRYDCFLGTDLDLALRSLAVNTLLITGVNTNSCVLATTITASTRDYACIVISECVDTVDGPGYHDAALRCIGRAFGWVMTGDEAMRVAAGSAGGAADGGAADGAASPATSSPAASPP
jgi:nicotinamidase-related amidase